MPGPSLKSTSHFTPALHASQHITSHKEDPERIKIENFIGYTRVPLGLAGPLTIAFGAADAGTKDKTQAKESLSAPLATTEATLIASCSRGSKAFNATGGIGVHVLDEGMSRAPAFKFDSPRGACVFVDRLRDPESTLRAGLVRVAESSSSHTKLKKLIPRVVGSWAHVVFMFTCGDAAGQNMVTFATQKACNWIIRESKGLEPDQDLKIKDFLIEGQTSSEKKATWGSAIGGPRGVEVISWGRISNAACQEMFGCETDRLDQAMRLSQNGCLRVGTHGHNVNVSNVLAAMFIATGQDVACITDACWCQFIAEYDPVSKDLEMSMYLPSLPVGTIGGGTNYETQREALRILGCDGNGKKAKLAGCVAAFALALDTSTIASVATDTFAASHERMRARI